MVHVSVQVVSSYVTPWLSSTCLISVISFVITLYNNYTRNLVGSSFEMLTPYCSFCLHISEPCMYKLSIRFCSSSISTLHTFARYVGTLHHIYLYTAHLCALCWHTSSHLSAQQNSRRQTFASLHDTSYTER
jgi:hypothetical protein